MKSFKLLLIAIALFLISCSQQQTQNAMHEDSMMDHEKMMHPVKEFDVIAKQFEFVPGVITVNQGDLVRLKVKSIDVPHGIGITEFGVNEGLPTNVERVVEFIADKKGTFTIFCTVYCGDGHGDMKGKLIVQ